MKLFCVFELYIWMYCQMFQFGAGYFAQYKQICWILSWNLFSKKSHDTFYEVIWILRIHLVLFPVTKSKMSDLWTLIHTHDNKCCGHYANHSLKFMHWERIKCLLSDERAQLRATFVVSTSFWIYLEKSKYLSNVLKSSAPFNSQTHVMCMCVVLVFK